MGSSLIGFCNCSDPSLENHEFSKSKSLENGKLGKESDYTKNKSKVLILDLPEYSPESELLSNFDAATTHSAVDNKKSKSSKLKVRLELGDNCYYEGQVKNSLFEGKGQLVLNDEIYLGEFKKGMKCGKGELYDSKKILKYKGDFIDNQKQGQGKIVIIT